jgi:hypothetical protein
MNLMSGAAGVSRKYPHLMGLCCAGDLDPITKEPFPELQYVPRSMPRSNSVQDDPFRTDNRRKQHRRRSAGEINSLIQSLYLIHSDSIFDLSILWVCQHDMLPAGTRRTLPVHANGIANYFKVLPVSRETQREFAAPRMFPGERWLLLLRTAFLQSHITLLMLH